MTSKNALNTTLLLGSLTALFLFIGQLLGGNGGMLLALIFAIVTNMGAWWFSDRIALRMNGAQEVTRDQAPQLYEMVTTLAQNADLPMPRVYVIDSSQPNAFATGRDPQHGAVAVTTGIMKALSHDELSGVIAHELAHIRNRDTLISSLSATMAGSITTIANMARWSLMFRGTRRNRDNGASNLLTTLALVILAPLAAVIIQMAISRSREFDADAGGAQILGDPRPLASALEKMEDYVAGHPAPNANPATAHMYIINPLRGQAFAGLFRTHPPTHERIQRLLAMQRSTP